MHGLPLVSPGCRRSGSVIAASGRCFFASGVMACRGAAGTNGGNTNGACGNLQTLLASREVLGE